MKNNGFKCPYCGQFATAWFENELTQTDCAGCKQEFTVYQDYGVNALGEHTIEHHTYPKKARKAA